MTQARYLVRFDDICPTMDWDIWERVEEILLENKIKPILAVVPNNVDEHLIVTRQKDDFWNRVRTWQGMGWTIALHGYEHRYVTQNSGLVGINKRSEFAGLPRNVQMSKLRKGIDIFKREGVSIDVWVAPAHSFDKTTVELLLENDINVISDGYFWRPVKMLGAIWAPQQLWRFRPFPTGIWTVCYHANIFLDEDIYKLKSDIDSYKSQVASIDEVLSEENILPATYNDKLFAWGWRKALKLKRRLMS